MKGTMSSDGHWKQRELAGRLFWRKLTADLVVCWALLQNWASFLANWAIKHVQPETADQQNSFFKNRKKTSKFQWRINEIRYISCCSDTKMSSLFPGEMIYGSAFIFF
jgi:hypothetical protein